MANVHAIRIVGTSLATYLGQAFERSTLRTVDQVKCKFEVIGSDRLAKEDEITPNVISLYLYRVAMNPHMRNSGVRRDPDQDPVPLSVDLHYLLTVWAGGPEHEHSLLAWALRELHLHPVLDSSSLSPEAGWKADEVIQLIPAEMATEDMMRVWDAVAPTYRLSVSYIARVVRIDPEAADLREHAPVVATRLGYRPNAAAAP